MALSLGKAQRLIFRPIMASPLMKWTWYPLKFELWFDTTLQNYWNWFLIWWRIILVKAPNHLLNRKSALVWYTISPKGGPLVKLKFEISPTIFWTSKITLVFVLWCQFVLCSQSLTFWTVKLTFFYYKKDLGTQTFESLGHWLLGIKTPYDRD